MSKGWVTKEAVRQATCSGVILSWLAEQEGQSVPCRIQTREGQVLFQCPGMVRVRLLTRWAKCEIWVNVDAVKVDFRLKATSFPLRYLPLLYAIEHEAVIHVPPQ